MIPRAIRGSRSGRTSRIGIFVLVAVLCLSVSPACSGDPSPGWASAHELALRSRSLVLEKPAYPEESLRVGTHGVSVVEVFVNREGRVEAATVLQAPDDYVEQAVLAASHEWEFEPLRRSGAPDQYLPVRGKLTFYFSILPDGTGTVLNPEETPDGAFARTTPSD